MESKDLREAVGHRVRISAGVQVAEGRLTDYEQSTMEIALWGSSTTRPGNEWYVTLDRAVHEFPLHAELEILD